MKNRFYLFLLSCCLLSACVTESIAPADIYTILPARQGNKATAQKPANSQVIIKLAPMRAGRTFTSTDILYTEADFEINSYVYSRWNDTPTRLLQTLFQVSIEQSGLFKAVIPSLSISKADLLLESTLLDFSHHVKADGRSEGVIRIHFYVIDNSTKKVIATREFSSTVTALTLDAQGAVKALNQAAKIVAEDLVAWLAGLIMMI